MSCRTYAEKKNLSWLQVIRRRFYFACICHLKSVCYSGAAVEALVEPKYYENFAERKNLYAKIARGERAPSKNIRKLFPELESIWKSPIWDAMALLDKPIEAFIEFYQTLPMKLQKIIFTKESSPKNGFTVKVSEPQIKVIQRFCCESALASLIALCVQQKRFHIAIGSNLETTLYNMLLDHFTVSAISFFNQDILEYIFEKLICKEDERYYQRSPEQRNRWLQTNQQISFLLGKELCIIKWIRLLTNSLLLDDEKKLLLICRDLGTEKVFNAIQQHSNVGDQVLAEVIFNLNSKLPKSRKVKASSFG